MISKFARLWPYIRAERPRLAGIVALTALSSALTVAQPWPLKLLIDYALGESDVTAAWFAPFADHSSREFILVAAGLALAVGLAGLLLNNLLTWSWSVTGQHMTMRLATDLFDRMQRLSLRFHAKRSAGDAMQRITGDTYAIQTVVDASLVGPLQQFLTIAMVGFVAWHLDHHLTLILLTTAPVLAATTAYFGSRIKTRSTSHREARSRLFAFVQQTLRALPIVQVSCAEPLNRKRFEELGGETLTTARAGVLTNDLFKSSNGLASAVAVAVVLLVGGHRVLDDVMTVGTLLVFLQYSRSLLQASRRLLQFYGKLRTAEAGVDRVLDILDSSDQVTDPAEPATLPPVETGMGCSLAMQGVTYGYEQGIPVLRDINLDVAHGETIALVGRTGAGKTTLASLIPRFFDPWQGSILIDGVDIRAVSLRDLRGRIGIVPQQPTLMPLTIAENIAYGRPDATTEEVRRAAHAANAAGFIDQLPQGYLTVVGEQGTTLSGGERQRLAIARALLNDAAIIVLDEPTAALDVDAELALMDALERLTADRTTVIIAHRLSTARRADRIVVLDDGVVVECGPHDELVARDGGAYHRLWHLHEQGEEVAEL